MKTLIQIWNWFNNKKTIIGIALVVIPPKAADYLMPLLANWGLASPVLITKIVFTLVWIGKGIGLIGIAHKMLKYKMGGDGTIPLPEEETTIAAAPLATKP